MKRVPTSRLGARLLARREIGFSRRRKLINFLFMQPSILSKYMRLFPRVSPFGIQEAIDVLDWIVALRYAR